MAAALLSAVALAIYPPDHFTHVTKLNQDIFESYIEKNVDAGKTVFVRWIASEG